MEIPGLKLDENKAEKQEGVNAIMSLEEEQEGDDEGEGDVCQEDEADLEELDAREATEFRSVVASANYLSADRPDMVFATKELCRTMAKPKKGCLKRLKRLARYLLQYLSVELRYENQKPQKSMKVYVDSNWAGCLRTRKSTSGGIIALGKHVVKSWSSTQGTVALFSGEAELYAIVEGAARALSVQSTMKDMSSDVTIEMFTDSSAAKGVVHRSGLGKIRHMHTKYLWVQDAVKEKRINVLKIEGKKNPADVATKFLSKQQMSIVLEPIGVKIKRR